MPHLRYLAFGDKTKWKMEQTLQKRLTESVSESDLFRGFGQKKFKPKNRLSTEAIFIAFKIPEKL